MLRMQDTSCSNSLHVTFSRSTSPFHLSSSILPLPPLSPPLLPSTLPPPSHILYTVEHLDCINCLHCGILTTLCKDLQSLLDLQSLQEDGQSQGKYSTQSQQDPGPGDVCLAVEPATFSTTT